MVETLLAQWLLPYWEVAMIFVMGIVGIFLKNSGDKAKSERDNLKESLKRVEEAKNIENLVDGLSDDDVIRKLRDNGWLR